MFGKLVSSTRTLRQRARRTTFLTSLLESLLRTEIPGLFTALSANGCGVGFLFFVQYNCICGKREREMFYLTTHSTHFIYGYMASDIWLRTILIVRKETSCRHMGYSFWLTARVLLYAPSHRQDSTYHSLCYTSCGALAGTRNSSMGPPHEGLIRRPIAPWANALPLSYVPLPIFVAKCVSCNIKWYWHLFFLYMKMCLVIIFVLFWYGGENQCV